jgi:bifunctional non-homologous end joining protein LigD
MTDVEVLEVSGRGVGISNPGKVLFPGADITKFDLARYYRDVGYAMLPHLKGRPLTLRRYPDGLGGAGFYQKQAPDYFPDWIDRVEVETANGPQVQVLASEPATLVYLADQGTISFHRWLARSPDLDRPDLMVLDLDPPDGDPGPVRRAARFARSLVEEIGVTPWLMATGSRGFHVVVPLRPGPSFDRVRGVASMLADELAERHPDSLTTETRKSKRGERVFIDYLRNAYGQTVIAPYSVRALAGAAVAFPLDWEELSSMDPDRHDLASVRRRLGQKPDPWQNLHRHAVDLESLARTGVGG